MTVLSPGFADPVRDSQACFRAVLDAMARPGTVQGVTAPAEPPAPLDRATAAVLLTLVDAETPLWLDEAAAGVAPWIGFHCGAPVAAAERAAFALALSMPELVRFDAGTDDAPERGATVILQVAGIGTGPGYRIRGPGLEGAATVRVEGLTPGFVEAWGRNHAAFPRGVDLILCAGDRLAAFPRTLSVEAA